MLEVARGLLLDPKLFLIDEPSIGLSPLMVQEVFAILKDLRDKGVTILLIEQNAKQALQISDYGLVLEQGQTRIEDTAPKYSCRYPHRAIVPRRRSGAGGGSVMSKRKFLVGLIGANIMKSLSPAMHADAFAAAGIEGYYHVMDVDVLQGRQLPQLFEAVKTAGFSGTNVTLSVQAGGAGAARRGRPRGARRSAPSTPSPLRRMAAPRATTPIAAVSAAASRKGLAAPARRPRPWCWSAPAAPDARLPSR